MTETMTMTTRFPLAAPDTPRGVRRVLFDSGYTLSAFPDDFLGSVAAVAVGGTVLDPLVVRQLMGRHREPIADLTPREREVLSLMAEGKSNAAIAEALTVTLAGVEKHTQRIFAKLGLSADDGAQHRRVAAVLAFLRS